MGSASWATQAVIYHLYPLGTLGAPKRNPLSGSICDRLGELHSWLDYFMDLGVNTLLLGPVFKSSTHGYDVIDYFSVDERLGDAESLRALSEALHRRGIRLILDGVFHHTGRDFPAFQDIRRKGAASPYRQWYHLDFAHRSPLGDSFSYEGWSGHYDLVKLNLRSPEVTHHVLSAVTHWIDEFDIDGMRIDAADQIDMSFQRELAEHCRRKKQDFWLVGEVVHGDYRHWANPSGLDSITNYEAYKGIWSSHNDKNYFEIAHSLKRQFGPEGIYGDLNLYSFVDNHDVDRIASILNDARHLGPAHVLLFTMPGVPALYYGSEWGLGGKRSAHSDEALRPTADPSAMKESSRHPQLQPLIKRLIKIRREHPSLQLGAYTELHVSSQQFAFMRGRGPEAVGVVVNSAEVPVEVQMSVPGLRHGHLVDVLGGGERFTVTGEKCALPLPPNSGRVLRLGRPID